MYQASTNPSYVPCRTFATFRARSYFKTSTVLPQAILAYARIETKCFHSRTDVPGLQAVIVACCACAGAQSVIASVETKKTAVVIFICSLRSSVWTNWD